MSEREPRPETGPMSFGMDWPGVFIRGDNAHGYAVLIQSIIEGTFPQERAAELLGGLLLLLQSCEVCRPNKLMPTQNLREFKTTLAGKKAPEHHAWGWDAEGNNWTLESLAAVTALKP